jgi:hypothetical protein
MNSSPSSFSTTTPTTTTTQRNGFVDLDEQEVLKQRAGYGPPIDPLFLLDTSSRRRDSSERLNVTYTSSVS